MTIASFGLLLLIVVPFALLVLDVARGKSADTIGRETVLKQSGLAAAAPAPAPVAPAVRSAAITFSHARIDGAIRPGEGMVYRGPSLEARR